MRKTYITKIPDHIGAFLLASKCLAELSVNITRVSYNKAVDAHTLFIDAEGTAEQLEEAAKRLDEFGYLEGGTAVPDVLVLEFKLPDVPGSVTPVLSLITEFKFNISYISSQKNGSDYQYFKIGITASDKNAVSEFVRRAEELFDVRVIDYNRSEKTYDNSVFYSSFVASLVEAAGIQAKYRDELLVNVNLAMQLLDERGQLPNRTFDAISKFASMLASCRGEAFRPRITTRKITDNTEITVIEPPCGSNTIIIKSLGEHLFIDSGYAYYEHEMLGIIRELVPEFDDIKKRIVLTHADVDHCGLLPHFDEIITSEKTAKSLLLSYEGKEDFREQNPMHKPYVRICKTLTQYEAPSPEKVNPLFRGTVPKGSTLSYTGVFSFGELNFEAYQGGGGHLDGELVLIDYENRVAFTGDIYINVGGLTPEQREHNKYAPILMNSVDTDKALCARERKAIFDRLGAGKWYIFGSHGAMREYEPRAGE